MAKKNKPTKPQPKPVPQPKKSFKIETEEEFNEKHRGKNPFEGHIEQELGMLSDDEKDMRDGVEYIEEAREFTQADIDKLKGRSISRPRWEAAQKAEVEAHNRDVRNTEQHYNATYKTYFKYVGLGTDLHGLNVIEIGPAMHSALAICSNWGKALIFEPIHSEELFSFVRNKGIRLVDSPIEDVSDEQLGIIGENWDGPVEVWLFNVMQHVIDPDEFVRKCKLMADRIRFFEPVNTPIEPHHPHSYKDEDYLKWFGVEACKLYLGGTEPNFHTADCVYGVWIKE